MLTKEYLRFRRRNGKWTPVFIDPTAPVFLELAESLLSIYRNGVEEKQRRGEIVEEVEPLLLAGRDPALGAALDKLLQDAATFEPARDLDYPFLRAALLKRSGEILAQALSQPEYRAMLEADPAYTAFEGADIYGDLPENERLTGLKNMTPQELTHRYNLAQVQGLLFYARKLVVHLPNPEAGELRRLFKYLKFFRLLAEIHREGNNISLEISGPFELFANTRKYALQLAAFFPALVLLPHWKLEAEIEWNKQSGKLELDERAGLRSHYRNFSSYVPEEITMFHRLFREKVMDWKIVGDAPLMDGGEGRIVFPDLSFQQEGEEPIHLELFHRWHRTELERRLKLLSEQPKLRLILGIDRGLANDAEYAAIETQYPMLAERLFRFRDFPGVDRVKNMLNAKMWRQPKPRRRRKSPPQA